MEHTSFIKEIIYNVKVQKSKNFFNFYFLLKKYFENYEFFREEDYEFLGNNDDIKVLFVDFQFNGSLDFLPETLEILIIEGLRDDLINLPKNLKYVVCPREMKVNQGIKLDLEKLHNILY